MTVIQWQVRHPDRAARASQRQIAVIARKFVTSRAAKDALMCEARTIAAAGRCAGWLQVLEGLEREGHDVVLLRIWATTNDRNEIDRLCAKARGGRLRLASSQFKPRKT